MMTFLTYLQYGLIVALVAFLGFLAGCILYGAYQAARDLYNSLKGGL